MPEDSTISLERDDHVLLIGLNRPEKRNAFNLAMLRELSLAYGELDRDPDLRCGVLFAHGEHFTGGLDLLDVGPTLSSSGWDIPEGGLDFTGLSTAPVRKPVVMAIQGRCLTLGIELALASDVRVAAADARFAQIEIKRGIMPFGGATIRFVRDCGWGNAMLHLLTADEFDAAEALRIGLVQAVVPPGRQLAKAREIADAIAAQAPLGVEGTLRNARLAWREGEAKAAERLLPEIRELMTTGDAGEGLLAFVERRDGVFSGR
ncbi:MAG TPA: crotonase/enoyl-CoA hydratase family protein [Candidatus Dormibacteraeota bacterium]|jgi:enoyl-CoA hydratase/carnithine racemase|nr:crotonase/enoyl-CoA hydratase family protein [Candidatus Dormibacteraeota bacterium]